MRSTRNGPSYEADCERILAAGLAYAEQHTARQLDRHLKRLLAEIDPATVVIRRRRALAERGVWIQHRGDGTADLSARLDSTDAEQVYAAIRAVALAAQRADSRTAEDVRRPFDLLMADALVDLILAPGATATTGLRTGSWSRPRST